MTPISKWYEMTPIFIDFARPVTLFVNHLLTVQVSAPSLASDGVYVLNSPRCNAEDCVFRPTPSAGLWKYHTSPLTARA